MRCSFSAKSCGNYRSRRRAIFQWNKQSKSKQHIFIELMLQFWMLPTHRPRWDKADSCIRCHSVHHWCSLFDVKNKKLNKTNKKTLQNFCCSAEMSAGLWIHLHIRELKSPLAPGLGQTKFLPGQSNKRSRLTLLTRTAPTCPVAEVAALDAWDVRLGFAPTALLLCYHSGDTYRAFNLRRCVVRRWGEMHQCPQTCPPIARRHTYSFFLFTKWLIRSSCKPPMRLNWTSNTEMPANV